MKVLNLSTQGQFSSPRICSDKTGIPLNNLFISLNFLPSTFQVVFRHILDQDGEAVLSVISNGMFHRFPALSACLYLAMSFYQQSPAGLKGFNPA